MSVEAPGNQDREAQARSAVLAERGDQVAAAVSELPGATPESIERARELGAKTAGRLLNMKIVESHDYKAREHASNVQYLEQKLADPNLDVTEQERASLERALEWNRQQASDFSKLANGYKVGTGMSEEELAASKAKMAAIKRRV